MTAGTSLQKLAHARAVMIMLEKFYGCRIVSAVIEADVERPIVRIAAPTPALHAYMEALDQAPRVTMTRRWIAIGCVDVSWPARGEPRRAACDSDTPAVHDAINTVIAITRQLTDLGCRGFSGKTLPAHRPSVYFAHPSARFYDWLDERHVTFGTKYSIGIAEVDGCTLTWPVAP